MSTAAWDSAQRSGLRRQMEAARLALAELRGALDALRSLGEGALLETTVVLKEAEGSAAFVRTRISPTGDMITRLELGGGTLDLAQQVTLVERHRQRVAIRAAEGRGRLRALLDLPRLLTVALVGLWGAGVTLYYALAGLLTVLRDLARSLWQEGLSEAFLHQAWISVEPVLFEVIVGVLGPIIWGWLLARLGAWLRSWLQGWLKAYAQRELGLTLPV